MSRKKNAAKPADSKQRQPEPLPAAIRTGLWAVWGYSSPAKEGGKPAKRPVRIGEFNAPIYISTDDPAGWTDYDTAVANLVKVSSPKKNRRTGEVEWEKAGLGRLCGSEPALTVMDVDDCIVKGELVPAAAEIVKRAGTYVEVSPSGKGLRLAFTGSKSDSLCMAEVGTVGGTRVELYDQLSTRYVTFTGNVLPGAKAKVAAMSKGFEKWFAEQWKRGGSGAARGSMRLVTEQRLSELQEGYANTEEARTLPYNLTRFLVVKDNGAELDRSAAFASLFSRLYGDPENGAAESLSIALCTLGDDMADKGARRVVVVETGEIVKVPFAVADAARMAFDIDERFKVRNALNDALPNTPAASRAALVRQFAEAYPQHAWHIAHGAIKHGVPLPVVASIVGDDTVRTVAEFMQGVRERDRRRA